MLARHGIEPAPERERKTNWTVPDATLGLIVAADFFTIEACTDAGIDTQFALHWQKVRLDKRIRKQ